MNPAILIPAYKPDTQLVTLVKELVTLSFNNIIIVDDGSPEDYQPLFDTLREVNECHIIKHPTNMGKGSAIKSGIREILSAMPEVNGCLTVDADGQHLPQDIQKIAQIFQQNPNSLILGSRNFGQKDIPLKSKAGNLLTRIVYTATTGKLIADTQTGLRAMPLSLMTAALNLTGNRYEFEMNELVYAAKNRIPILEVPIETVYIDDNSSSHFKPLLDSIRIYAIIFKFLLSSVSCFIVDISLFALFYGISRHYALPFGLLVSVALARVFSSMMNFIMNKSFVFRNNDHYRAQLIKYYALCMAQMLASWLLLEWISSMNPKHIVGMKILVDFSLFIISFSIQKVLIFRKAEHNDISF